jgi:hypothetical protein
MGHYTRTDAAFHALIYAEVSARMVLEAAQHLKGMREMGQLSKPQYTYVPPPAPTEDEVLRAHLEDLRASVPGHFRGVQDAADSYFKCEAEFRKEVEHAKRMADLAAPELDSQATPPLKRDSIAIKRALGQLSASVPYPLTAPWAEATEEYVQQRMKTAIVDVQRWIQELRLLVQPEHCYPPPDVDDLTRTGNKARPESRKRAVRLHDRQWKILAALYQEGALSDSNAMKAPVIAYAVVQQREAAFVKNHLATLRRKKLIDSKEGKGGGYWILPAGVAVLIEKYPEMNSPKLDRTSSI